MEVIILQFIANVLLIVVVAPYSRDKYARLALYIFPLLAILSLPVKLLIQAYKSGAVDPSAFAVSNSFYWAAFLLALLSVGIQLLVNKIIIPNLKR